MGQDTEKLRDPYHDSRERGIHKSRREHDRSRQERPDAQHCVCLEKTDIPQPDNNL